MFTNKLFDFINISLNSGKIIKCISVDLPENDYVLCEQASQNMWCSKKKGTYGKGLINTENDPYKVERIGRLGEKAFEKLTGLSCDFSYINQGDEYDFIIGNDKIDVKTSSSISKNECGYIMAINEYGIKKELTSNIFIFSYLSNESIQTRSAQIIFLGFVFLDNIIKKPLEKSKYANHFNYVVKYDELLPIELILKAIKKIIN